MKTSEHLDRLIDVLLEEQLGGQAPPDVTGRVLAAAGARRLLRWTALAAAALLLVCCGLWTLLTRPQGYPAPRVSGDYRVVTGESAWRGAVLESGPGGARLEMGGYCVVEMAPHTRVGVEGAERNERIRLERGGVRCEVESGRGGFRVVTDLGEVSVVGTRFVVRVEGGGQMEPRRMFVKVLAGAVLLTTAYASETLQAGEQKTVAEKPGGKVIATFLEGNRAATAIWVKVRKVLAGEPELAGRTVKFNARWVKTERGWRPNADQQKLFRSLDRGDVLRIGYYVEEGYRVRTLEVIERAPAGKIETGKPTYRARDGRAWRERGRIVGPFRDAPAAEMDVLNADGKVVQSLRIRPGARGYETDWLPPGVYTLRVAARGFNTLERPGLQVKAGNDLVVPIEFSGRAGEGADIRGFRGAVVGTIVEKGGDGFALKVEKVTHIWKRSRVRDASRLVGRRLSVVVLAGRFPDISEKALALLKDLKEGDRVQVGLFGLENGRFAVVELFRRVE